MFERQKPYLKAMTVLVSSFMGMDFILRLAFGGTLSMWGWFVSTVAICTMIASGHYIIKLGKEARV